jgi:hypothetical protein
VCYKQDFYAEKKMFLASIGNDVPPFVCRYSNDDSSISHVTNAAQQWTIDNAIPYECTLTQCATPEIVENTTPSADALVMQIVTSDSMHYSGGFRAHDRVLRIFRNDFFEDQSKLELHVSTATIDLIKTQYIAPMKQRRQLLVQTLQQPPEHVSLEAMLDKHIQELMYLSPVFIPIDDVNHKTTHAITCDTYNNGSNSGTATTTIDESKHPHIVFYIIPYNRGPSTTASTASDVLCGKRDDDKLTFVITVPKDLALHLDTSAVASLITKWLSKYADFKLDMFLLPDNWSSWRRQSALSSTECRVTPISALFSMQLCMLIVHEQCLQSVSSELSKVCKQLLEVATQHMTSTDDVIAFKSVLRLLSNKVCDCIYLASDVASS